MGILYDLSGCNFIAMQDIPIPAFMQNKPEEEWSEDEKKAAQEYERKVKELNEEREKYRKVILPFDFCPCNGKFAIHVLSC